MAQELVLKGIKISRLIEIDEEQNFVLGLEVIAGFSGLSKEIKVPEVNRPGLPLAGYFDCFAFDRIQIFGMGEMSYMNKLVAEGNLESIEQFFGYDIPVCVVTHGAEVSRYILDIADSRNVPVLRTRLATDKFISLVGTVLSDMFSPYTVYHGDFVSIYNVGVLIIGQSGIGKSESVLGLIERGHKFICDDMVKVKRMRTPRGYELKGEPHVDYGPYIEIRGIGIINVSQYYGEGKILPSERLGLVTNLLEWSAGYNYDRLGMDEKYTNVLGIDVPYKEIPVSSGRNIPLLIEVAAYREVMRKLGYNSAEELERKIINFMRREREAV